MAFALLLGMPALTGVASASPTTDGATLNGGTQVTVLPGSSITAAVTTTAGNPAADRVGSIGWRVASSPPGAVTCRDVPDQRNGTETTAFPITAPAVPGTYHAYFAAYSDGACQVDAGNLVTLGNGVLVSSPAADLALTKSDGVSSVAAGSSTTYVLTLRNNGPGVVPAGVVISDPIPSGTTGSEAETACSISAGTLRCTTPATMAVGSSFAYRVTLAVGASYGGDNLRNRATIASSPVQDPAPGNDVAIDTNAVTATPDGDVTYQGLLAGPGLADMYPVDIVDSGAFYYVVDPGRYSVFKIDRTSGQIVATAGGHKGRAKGEFGAARSISADAAGNVYVADTPNNRIQVLSPGLGFLRQWGGGGTDPGRFNMVYGVTVGMGRGVGGVSDEVVYTTDGSRVQKFTRTGTFISQFGHDALNQPRHLAVNPLTRDLYVVSARDRQIVVFDQHGVERFRFGSGGTGNGQFLGDIRGIDIDDAGRVYVSDDGNHRVQVFDANGGYLYQFGNAGSGDQYLTDARGLTVTSDGVICVSDEWDFAIKEYRIDLDGTGASFARMLFGGPAPVPGFNSPRGLTVNETTGEIYAVDWWNQRLQRFDADGSFRTVWGRRGTIAEPGSINFAWDAAVDPDTGNVFVANRESHEIEVFDANGSYLTRWGTRGTTTGRFTFPQGVAFDPTDGSLLVTDSGNGRIQRFAVAANGTGTFVASYGTKGTGAGQFSVPAGIDVAADGTIWVADTQNDRVQRRNPTTGVWTPYAVAQGDPVGLNAPWGVTVAPGGQIWVADSGNDRLVRMSGGGVLVGVVDADTLGLSSMDAPFEATFGIDGRIFVSVVWDNRVLELSQT